MKKSCMLFLALLFLFGKNQAQSIGIGTTTPHPSAQLEIQAIDKGFLVPRMTTAERLVISSPATGLLVYDTNTNSFWFYAGASWQNLASLLNALGHSRECRN